MQSSSITTALRPASNSQARRRKHRQRTSPDYKALAYLFNMRLAEEIEAPSDEYRLDKLPASQPRPPTNGIIASFETEEWCKAEDRKRAIGLRAATAQIPLDRADLVSLREHPKSFITTMNELTREMALDLADRLDISASGGPLTTSLPSAIFKRTCRKRLLGAILRLIEERPNLPRELIVITNRNWIRPICHFVLPLLHCDPVSQLKSDLSSAGGSASAGFLAAHQEVEFIPAQNNFQFYFRGIVVGEKIKAIQELLRARGYDSSSMSRQPFIKEPGPYSRVQIASALSRFWPQQSWVHLATACSH